MNLVAAVIGSIEAIFGAVRGAIVSARGEAVVIVTRTVVNRLRGQVAAAGLPASVGNAWRSRIYGEGGTHPVGFVWTRMPNAIDAFDRGATIRPKGGRRYLCIPTGFNKPLGRRMQKGGTILSPSQMGAMKGMTFVLPAKKTPGVLVWFLRVTEAGERYNGGTRQLAYAGGTRLVGSGRTQRTRKALKFGAVPMFILVPGVTLRKRLDIDGIVAEARANLPGLFIERLNQHGGEEV